MNISAIRSTSLYKDEKFHSKMRNNLLKKIEKHQESEFDRMLAEGLIEVDKDKKVVGFRRPEVGEL